MRQQSTHSTRPSPYKRISVPHSSPLQPHGRGSASQLRSDATPHFALGASQHASRTTLSTVTSPTAAQRHHETPSSASSPSPSDAPKFTPTSSMLKPSITSHRFQSPASSQQVRSSPLAPTSSKQDDKSNFARPIARRSVPSPSGSVPRAAPTTLRKSQPSLPRSSPSPASPPKSQVTPTPTRPRGQPTNKVPKASVPVGSPPLTSQTRRSSASLDVPAVKSATIPKRAPHSVPEIKARPAPREKEPILLRGPPSVEPARRVSEGVKDLISRKRSGGPPTDVTRTSGAIPAVQSPPVAAIAPPTEGVIKTIGVPSEGSPLPSETPEPSSAHMPEPTPVMRPQYPMMTQRDELRTGDEVHRGLREEEDSKKTDDGNVGPLPGSQALRSTVIPSLSTSKLAASLQAAFSPKALSPRAPSPREGRQSDRKTLTVLESARPNAPESSARAPKWPNLMMSPRRLARSQAPAADDFRVASTEKPFAHMQGVTYRRPIEEPRLPPSSNFLATQPDIQPVIVPPPPLAPVTRNLERPFSILASQLATMANENSATPASTRIASSAFVCSTAILQGPHSITIGENTVIHPGAFIAATSGTIDIGTDNVIEEYTCIVNRSEKPLKIGSHNHIEQGVCVVDASLIGDCNVFGVHSSVGPQAIVGDACSIAAGCVVGSGHHVESGHVVLDQRGSTCGGDADLGKIAETRKEFLALMHAKVRPLLQQTQSRRRMASSPGESRVPLPQTRRPVASGAA